MFISGSVAMVFSTSQREVSNWSLRLLALIQKLPTRVSILFLPFTVFIAFESSQHLPVSVPPLDMVSALDGICINIYFVQSIPLGVLLYL